MDAIRSHMHGQPFRVQSLRALLRARKSLIRIGAAMAFIVPNVATAQRVDGARQAFAASSASAVDSLDAISSRGGLAQAPQGERSRGGRIALQFLASSAGAAGVGLVGYFMFDDVGTKRVEGDAGYTRAGNVAYLVGSATGATLGAHLVGRSMGGHSPLWATAAGAAVGTLPLFLAAGIDEPYLPLMGIILGWIPQAAFATIGYEAAGSRPR